MPYFNANNPDPRKPPMMGNSMGLRNPSGISQSLGGNPMPMPGGGNNSIVNGVGNFSGSSYLPPPPMGSLNSSGFSNSPNPGLISNPVESSGITGSIRPSPMTLPGNNGTPYTSPPISSMPPIMNSVNNSAVNRTPKPMPSMQPMQANRNPQMNGQVINSGRGVRRQNIRPSLGGLRPMNHFAVGGNY